MRGCAAEVWQSWTLCEYQGSASSLVFEGKRDTRAESGHLAVLHLHVHLGHFRDAQVTHEPAAVSTALRPASSHDVSLTPTTSTIL